MYQNNYFENLIKQVKNGKKIDSAGSFKSCYYFGDKVVLKYSSKSQQPGGKFNLSQQQKSIACLKSLGFKTPQIVYFQKISPLKKIKQFLVGDDVYQVQDRAKGFTIGSDFTPGGARNLDKLAANNRVHFAEILKATDEQFIEYMNNVFIAHQLSLTIDMHTRNVFYNNQDGFSFIDLPPIPNYKNKETFKSKIYRRKFNEKELVKSLLKPISFNAISHGSIEPIYNNMIRNKLVSLIDRTNIPFRNGQLEAIKDLLVPNDSSNKTITNAEQASILESINDNNPNTKKFVEDTFYNNCMKDLQFNGVPAAEYYSQFKTQENSSDETLDYSEDYSEYTPY